MFERVSVIHDPGSPEFEDEASGPTATTPAGRSDHIGGEPVVSLDDVEVHFETEQGFIEGPFNDPETVGAVDGTDLDSPENDVGALVDESGCGKITLGKAQSRPSGRPMGR